MKRAPTWDERMLVHVTLNTGELPALHSGACYNVHPRFRWRTHWMSSGNTQSFLQQRRASANKEKAPHQAVSLRFPNEFTEFHPQCTRQRLSNLNPHADLAEFDGANVGAVNVGPLCKRLLG